MANGRWDIFCNVIDNFGDIGVCWRLARQLADEHDLQVRLWVDDLASFQRLNPGLDPAAERQLDAGVEIRHWGNPLTTPGDAEFADVVIEAFACTLPEPYLAAMAARSQRPVWLNLEYLSAEDWTTGCHGLSSPHPRLPLVKHFFFPGFTPVSGGVLRECDVFERRDAWRNDPARAATHFGFADAPADECRISLFAYENAALPTLLDCWAVSERPIRCLVPEGRSLHQIAALTGLGGALGPGEQRRLGQLTLHALPFVRQQDYDLLLWTCDVNFVRGEDSLVRALWAAVPLVWQLYPQTEAAQMPKLAAFLALDDDRLSGPDRSARRTFWQSWNLGDADAIALAWHTFQEHLPALRDAARRRCQQLSSQADLAARLVRYCEDLL